MQKVSAGNLKDITLLNIRIPEPPDFKRKKIEGKRKNKEN